MSSILESFLAGTPSSVVETFPLLCMTLLYLLVDEDEVIATKLKIYENISQCAFHNIT